MANYPSKKPLGLLWRTFWQVLYQFSMLRARLRGIIKNITEKWCREINVVSITKHRPLCNGAGSRCVGIRASGREQEIRARERGWEWAGNSRTKGALLTGVDSTENSVHVKVEYIWQDLLVKIPRDPRTWYIKRQDVTFLGNPNPKPILVCTYLVQPSSHLLTLTGLKGWNWVKGREE